LVHWFLLFFFSHGPAAIASSHSSSHLGLLLLPPLILLLTWGCYSSPLASVLFLGEISPTGDPKNESPVQTLQRNFFLKIFKTFAIFLRKKKIARFRQ
jgi:hypothetical protein